MAHSTDDAKPLTEERYITSTSSSNLRVQAERGGPADVLVAAGWSASRIGTALMRLHTKPDRAGLELVQVQVAMHAHKLGIERPDAVATRIVAWWLHKVCPVCSGRRYEVIPGTPSLSTRHCKACEGTGEAKLPHGYEGRQLVTWMEDCKQAAVAGIRQRLTPTVRRNVAQKA